MPKKKVTVEIEKKVWKDFLSRVVRKYGTTKKCNLEIEKVISEYLQEYEKEELDKKKDIKKFSPKKEFWEVMAHVAKKMQGTS